MPKKSKLKLHAVSESFRIMVNVTIQKLLSSDEIKEWEYPSSFTKDERAYIHQEVGRRGLKSKSRGKGSSRYITIYKRDGSAIMQKDPTLDLTQNSRALLFNLFQKQPVTPRERQDCLPPPERTKDTFQDGKEQSRAIGRLAVGTPQIPTASVNRSLIQFRSTLPVYALRDHILHTINDNQVTIITGQTGSGKTTQVPQYLLEWHERVSRPCRILCTQPRRISAVSVSERVALERSEKLGQSVGYQIRLEARVSPCTVLTYCTTGVLLRTLMAGDAILASITHIIVDEVHERDRLTDFLLIILRELIAKYRALRLILISATLDAERFSAYFNNCPIISVPGKSYEVKQFFLEDVLKITGYMNSKVEKFRKELEQKKKKAENLSKWTEAVSNGTQLELAKEPTDDELSQMDELLFDAWVKGDDEGFTKILDLVQSKNIPVDYQHAETGITALMVAAFRGKIDIVENLLNLGSNTELKASNNFSALDWAESYDQKEVSDLIQAFLFTLSIKNESNAEPLEVRQRLNESDRELLDLYHCSFNDEMVDRQLILALIAHLHNENTKGAILVFLPGYDDIIGIKDILLQEEKRLSQKVKMQILILHSNMQTSDQKLVFKPPPNNTRKIILSTNIAETSLTIDDVIFVIDSGRVKENAFNSLCGTSQLCTVWVSKSCVTQRKGRAGRTQPGFCYHLFSSLRYEAMERYKTPEILRTPILELSLYAKQLAPPNTSIVDFISRALDPPSSTVSRSAVTLLKTMDALDTWEDLTELGHHLLDIPVDPKYGKMLIYASVLKCLDPVLTIVCCLSYRDIFTIPAQAEKRNACNRERWEFSAGSLSDHMVLLRVFQGWQEARKQFREKAYCEEHFINGGTMEMVLSTRAQILAQLRASGFVKAKGPGDIKYVNLNSDNWAIVKAALVGGLYPNIARVDREDNVLRTMKEHKVSLHTSSAILERENGKTSPNKLPTDWVMFEEPTRVGRRVQIKTATVVSPLTVAIFAGPSKIPIDAISDSQLEGSQASDSEEEEIAPDHTATLKLDDWIMFRMDPDCARLAVQLRIKWHSLLLKKLRSTSKMLTNVDELVITTIVRVLSTEEQAIGLIQPLGVGRRPYLMNPDLPGKRYGNNKGQHDPLPTSPSLPSDGNKNSSPAVRYFVIKAGQVKSIEPSLLNKAWAFSQSTHSKIVQAYKGGKTVFLIFSIQGSGHFQGYARLNGDSPLPVIPELGSNPPLPIEWLKRTSIPCNATRHLINPYNDNNKVQVSRDGQELEPSVGEELCRLLEASAPFPQYNIQRNVRNHRPPHIYHNTNYKM